MQLPSYHFFMRILKRNPLHDKRAGSVIILGLREFGLDGLRGR